MIFTLIYMLHPWAAAETSNSVSEHVKIVGQSPQNSYGLSNWEFEIQEVPIANIHPSQQGHDHRRLKLMRMSYIHVNVALFV